MHPTHPSRRGPFRALLLALAAGASALSLSPVGAQQTGPVPTLGMQTEPVTDMEVTVLLVGGDRFEGVLTAVSPERISIRVDGMVRDIERSRIERMEYDIVLVQRDGQRLVGRFLLRDRDWITLRVAGVDARIPVDTVERIELQMPLRRRYEQMRSLIDDADVDRLLLVAEWLRSVHLYDEALRELDHILEVDRFNDRARNLRELVGRQIDFRERREARERERDAASGEPAAPVDDTVVDENGGEPVDEAAMDRLEQSGRRIPLGQRRDFPLLSQEQVSLLKVYELDLTKPARILINRETITKLLERYAGDPLIPATRVERDAFYRRPAAEILDIMFRLQARELYGEVRVLTDIDSMRRFRDTIQTTWLLQNCSTSGCHGDANASGLTLYRRRMGAEQSVYTNFVILDRYRTSDGQPLIDWQSPERSLLMQMGMTRQNAYRPHPEVHGWRPVFRTASDRRFREAVAWIESMYRPRSEVPVEYTPPGEAFRGGNADAPKTADAPAR